MSDPGSINQRWSLEGSDEFIAQLRKIADEAAKTQSALSGATEKASHSVAGLEAATASLSAAFRDLSGFAGAAAGPISRILSAAGSLTSGFTAIGTAIVGVTAGLGALAKQGADAADEIRDGALRVGTSAEQFSTLRFALQQSGAGAEGFERAMGKVFEASNKADEAGDKTAAGADKIEAATEKMAATNRKIADLFQKRSQDVADEQRKSLEQIADLTRKKGTEQEEIVFQSNRRLVELERQHTRALNEIIAQRNRDAQDRLAQFNKSISDAAQKAATGGDDFAKLGVKLKGSNGEIRDTAEIFKDVAEQVAKIENPTARSAKAIELFSRRAGPKLVEALSLGRQGIEDLQKEAIELGLQFDKATVKIGDDFNDAIAKVTGTIAATSQKIGLLFAPAFTAIAEAMAKAFGSLQKPILDALAPIAKDFENLFKGNIDQVKSVFLIGMRDIFVGIVIPALKAAAVVISSVLQTIGAAFQGLADVINKVFGTKFTAVDIPAFIIAMKLGAAAVGVLTTAFIALRAATLANPLVAIATGVTVLAAVIITNWEPIKQFFADLPNTFEVIGLRLQRLGEQQGGILGGFVKIAGDFVAAIGKLFNGDLQGASDEFSKWWKDFLTLAFVTLIDAAVEAAKQKLIELGNFMINKFKELGVAIATEVSRFFGRSTSTASQGSIPSNRAGGYQRGPGTAVSDSFLSWISNGEFIVNAAATRVFRPLLEAINKGITPWGGKGAPGFALGGIATATRAPFFTNAGGRSLFPSGRRGSLANLKPTAGFSSGGRPFTLVIDGRTFGGMTASDDVINDFIQFARGAKMRSLGKKPSYYGNG